jgi:hypothetical protein
MLGTMCTDKLLDYLLSTEPQHWQSTTIDLAGAPLTVELRGISPSLSGPIRLTLADKVSVPRSMGPRWWLQHPDAVTVLSARSIPSRVFSARPRRGSNLAGGGNFGWWWVIR